MCTALRIAKTGHRLKTEQKSFCEREETKSKAKRGLALHMEMKREEEKRGGLV